MVGTKGRSGGLRPTQTVAQSATPTKPPTKPRGLSKSASRYWNKLIKMFPENVLTPIDGFELEILCNLLVQSDHLADRLNNDPTDDKANRLYLQTFKEIHRLSACFGLNPADRNRLKLAPPEETSDPITAFLNRNHASTHNG